MVFNNITYYPIFGLPLIVYGGILTLLCLLSTAFIMIANMRGWAKIPFQWHHRLAFITIALALIHGFLGLMSYL